MPDDQITPDQGQRDQATTILDRNVFLDAGAGSGKTDVLMKRYLQILRQDLAEVSQIVAITFTEKAAREMKDRIRREIPKELPKSPTPDDRKKWERHLRDLENAPISTIHSFCARLLREYPVAAKIDPEFQVLDETQRNILLLGVVEQFLLEALSGGPPENSGGLEGLATLAADFGIRRLTEAFTTALSDSELCEKWVLPEITDTELKDQWQRVCREVMEGRLRSWLEDGTLEELYRTIDSTKATDPSDKLAAIREAVIEPLKTLLSDAPMEVRLSDAVVIGGMSSPGAVGSQKNWPSKEALTELREALKTLRDMFADFKALCADAEVQTLTDLSASHTVALIAGLREAYLRFQDEKRSRSLLDFDDLQIFVRRMLHDNALRRQCRGKFKQILVDEFQDTNDLQKGILWSLTEEGEGEGEDPGAKLFVVGDAKQSIYRFRGANVEVFNEVLKQFKQEDKAETLELTHHFRSQKPLLEFFNRIFSHDAVMGASTDRPLYETAYARLTAQRKQPTVKPPVRISALRASRRHDSQEESEEQAEETLEGFREAEGRLIAQKIQALVNDERPRVLVRKRDGSDELRPVRYGDIAMLFRSTTNLNLYERALRQARIPYYVDSGRGLYQRLEILDILSVLKLLERPDDSFALASVLRSPCVGISDATLYWLAHDPGLVRNFSRRPDALQEPPFGRIEPHEIEKLQFASSTMRALRRIKNRIPVADLIEEIIHRTGLTAVLLTQFNGERAAANLRKLVDIARAVESSGLLSLQDFIRHLDLLQVTEEREGEAAIQEEDADAEDEAESAVQMLTVHKAKAREWPVVFLPDLARGEARWGGPPVFLSRTFGLVVPVYGPKGTPDYPGPTKVLRAEERKREVAERRRLLYVAMTRAKDLLLMTSALPETTPRKPQSPRQPEEGKSWLDWLSRAMEVDWDNPCPPTPDCEIKVVETSAIPHFAPHTHHSPSLARELENAIRSAAPTTEEPGPADLRLRVLPIDADLLQRRSFPVAQLREFFTCPYRFYLARVRALGEKLDPRSEIRDPSSAILSASKRGTLIHRLLQGVSLDPSTDPEAAIASALIELDLGPADLQESQLRELRQVADRFLQSPVADWFGKTQRQKSEYAFAVLVDDTMIEGKIDWLGGDVERWTHLLDYKTGKDILPEKRQEYQYQIGLYSYALSCAEQLPEKAAIYYVDDDELSELDPGKAAAEAREKTALILAQIRAGEFSPQPGKGCAFCPQRWACEAGEAYGIRHGRPSG